MKFRKYIAFLLIAAIVFSLTACRGSDYKKAVELQETGYYEEAIELFTELGDYEDSPPRTTRTVSRTKGKGISHPLFSLMRGWTRIRYPEIPSRKKAALRAGRSSSTKRKSRRA